MRIKLKDLLREMSLNQGMWMAIPHSELDQYEQQIYELIQNAYKEIGGNLKFKNVADILNPKNDYEVIDLDADNQPNAVSASKNTPVGTKFVASGHDGSKEAKRALVTHRLGQLKHPGYFIEASGRVKDILIAAHIPAVDDQVAVTKALGGKTIEWHGDGTYTREIQGEKVVKMMFGKPRV
jgi:hypothetical protein